MYTYLQKWELQTDVPSDSVMRGKTAKTTDGVVKQREVVKMNDISVQRNMKRRRTSL